MYVCSARLIFSDFIYLSKFNHFLPLLLHYDLQRAFVNAYKTRIKSEILKRRNMKYVNELFIKDEVSIPQDHLLCRVGVISVAVFYASFQTLYIRYCPLLHHFKYDSQPIIRNTRL